MRYTYNDVKLSVESQEFDKNTPKEMLQYAVGGLLYMPANQSNIENKIISKEYSFVKSMVLDLEDSLGDDQVGFGKRRIVKTIESLKEAVESSKLSISDIPLIFVRVRNPDNITEICEMLNENIVYLTGFNLPKFDKHCCEEYIRRFNEVSTYAYKINGTNLYIMPIIENKTAMYRQLRMDNLLSINNSIRPISDKVLNIRVGGADFSNIFGIRRSVKNTIYDIGVVRSVLNDIMNVFGKSYVVSAPVWEYFGTKAGEEGLLNELRADSINGFIGKTAIHPTQLPIIQKFNIVDKFDYLDAISIIGTNSNITGVQKTASNRMNEVKTHMKWARRIISLSTIYGVKENED